tara:strand:+ start:2223 stop:2897 length:675 start_codon:yes stop_codon:yes gene_type:complete
MLPMTLDKAKLKRYFFTGLLVVIPIWGTFLILQTLLAFFDGIFGDLFSGLTGWYIPGLGIVMLIGVVLLAGVLTTNIVGQQLHQRWEAWVKSVPIVQGIYSTLQSVTDIISIQQKDKFRKVVMIQFPKNGCYCFAFVTGVVPHEMQHISPKPLINVYVPTAPNPTSGYYLVIPEDEAVSLSISVDDAMKMIVSGGLYVPSGQRMPMKDGDPGNVLFGEHVKDEG